MRVPADLKNPLEDGPPRGLNLSLISEMPPSRALWIEEGENGLSDYTGTAKSRSR